MYFVGPVTVRLCCRVLQLLIVVFNEDGGGTAVVGVFIKIVLFKFWQCHRKGAQEQDLHRLSLLMSEIYPNSAYGYVVRCVPAAQWCAGHWPYVAGQRRLKKWLDISERIVGDYGWLVIKVTTMVMTRVMTMVSGWWHITATDNEMLESKKKLHLNYCSSGM